MKPIVKVVDNQQYCLCQTCDKWYLFNPLICDKDYMCQPCATKYYKRIELESERKENPPIPCARKGCSHKFKRNGQKRFCSQECYRLDYDAKKVPYKQCGVPHIPSKTGLCSGSIDKLRKENLERERSI